MLRTHFIDHEIFPGFFIGDRYPVKLMGIINLSPESFYANSFIPKEKIREKIHLFLDNGATMLDFGARSTAPWSDPITIEQEEQRLMQALQILPDILPSNTIISIDTQYAQIARKALEFGKDHQISMMINDISSFQTDPELISVIVEYDCPVIIMATFKKPGDAKSPAEIKQALSTTLNQLKEAGYDCSKVIIDPGIGKWVKEKTFEYDLAIIDQLESFREFGHPILIGLSRKSFIGTVLDEPNPVNRDVGSWSATSIAVYNGAHIIRTHDVDRCMRQTLQMASAIRGKSFLPDPKPHKIENIQNFDLKMRYRKEFQ